MFIFETYDFAPIWLKVASNMSFEAIAVIRASDKYNDGEYWRDRTEEVEKMLVGFGNETNVVHQQVYRGSELKEMGWDIQGVRLAQNFKIIWK